MKGWSRRIGFPAYRPRSFPALLSAVLGISAFGCGTVNPDPAGPASGTPGALTCSEDQINEQGLLKAGHYGDGEAILANGRRITPVGDRIPTGRFPLGIRINADETRAYVVHNGDKSNSLMVLDLVEKQALQIVPLIAPFRAVALSPDESMLYVGGGHSGKVYFFELDENGLCKNVDDEGVVHPDDELYLGGYISDIEVTSDGAILYGVAATNSRVYAVDTQTRTIVRTLLAGTQPYDMVLSSDESVLYFSNLTASTVTAVDAVTGQVLASVPAGKDPMSMALSPDGATLYVTSSDTDEVYVIDTDQNEAIAVIDLSGHPLLYKHGNVNGVAVSPDGSRLYVSEASFNRVNVVDTTNFEVLGAIPTGWYPTEVVAGNKAVYIASSKGMGSEGYNGLKKFFSFISVVPHPDDATLAEWTTKATENNNRTLDYFTGDCNPDSIPVLSGKDSPIEHVVLVVRENKTYDMVMGDFERGDGDPELVVFGEKYTPNFHKLAREYVNMDNYYANAEASIQGHMWTSSAHCNDYTEKTYYSDFFTIPGYDITTLSGPGSIFDHCFAHGVSFRNYGEFPSFGQYMFDEYRDFFDAKYPFWTNEVSDVDKAAEFIREMELGIFPQFIYVVLPNDHTFGGDPGKPTPQYMVADNDRGTAMLVEAISSSIYWPKTAIFIIEDDPQGSGDHVEAHRSLCAVISPWVKRGYTSSVHYDIPSLYKTIELILGLPPLGKNDAMASPMLDIWVDGNNTQPDYTPFLGVPVDVPLELNPENHPLAHALDHCDFSELDGCTGLGSVLWKMMKGDVEPPPYAKGIDW